MQGSEDAPLHLDVGSSVYVYRDGQGWGEAKVASVDAAAGSARVRRVSPPGARACPEEEVKITNMLAGSMEAPKGLPEMTALDVLSEASLQQNLCSRYERDEIYTSIGPLLVSLNPYKRLPIYEEEHMERYSRGKAAEPHLFRLGRLAVEEMVNASGVQSVLISGESGAGKTEATKYLLRYLTTTTGAGGAAGALVEQQIIQSNPLMEAFGNAKTCRNHNSSRFGKFFYLQYDRSHQLVGSSISMYLLEKSRVVAPPTGERSYHILYQLCAAAATDAGLGQRLQLDAAEGAGGFTYCMRGGVTTIAGVDDAADFGATITAMATLGFSEEDRDAVMRVLAGILHLGNVSFDSKSGGSVPSASVGGSRAAVTDDEAAHVVAGRALSAAASLLGLDEATTKRALESRSMRIDGQTVETPVSVASAGDGRDALAKVLYGRLFEWLVARIDESMSASGSAAGGLAIGVLDIFGFEVMEKVNSFEQLCINYANERLHQQFNRGYFTAELEEFASEGITIDPSSIKYPDNQDCLDLFEQRPLGLLSLMEESCRLAQSTDQMMVQTFCDKLSASSRFEKVRTDRMAFVINHFACPVKYDAAGMIDKNLDNVPAGLVEVACASTQPLVRELFESKRAAAGGGPKRALYTVAGEFKNQLTDLMNTLTSSSLHYIRCIKPNTVSSSDLFDKETVLRQLRYTGIVDVVRTRRSFKYDRRIRYQEVIERAGGIPREDMSAVQSGSVSSKDWVAGLCRRHGLGEGDFLMGHTKLFLRDDALIAALAKRQLMAARIQGLFRVVLWRKRRRLARDMRRVQASATLEKAREKHMEMRDSSRTKRLEAEAAVAAIEKALSAHEDAREVAREGARVAEAVLVEAKGTLASVPIAGAEGEWIVSLKSEIAAAEDQAASLRRAADGATGDDGSMSPATLSEMRVRLEAAMRDFAACETAASQQFEALNAVSKVGEASTALDMERALASAEALEASAGDAFAKMEAAEGSVKALDVAAVSANAAAAGVRAEAVREKASAMEGKAHAIRGQAGIALAVGTQVAALSRRAEAAERERDDKARDLDFVTLSRDQLAEDLGKTRVELDDTSARATRTGGDLTRATAETAAKEARVAQLEQDLREERQALAGERAALSSARAEAGAEAASRLETARKLDAAQGEVRARDDLLSARQHEWEEERAAEAEASAQALAEARQAGRDANEELRAAKDAEMGALRARKDAERERTEAAAQAALQEAADRHTAELAAVCAEKDAAYWDLERTTSARIEALETRNAEIEHALVENVALRDECAALQAQAAAAIAAQHSTETRAVSAEAEVLALRAQCDHLADGAERTEAALDAARMPHHIIRQTGAPKMRWY